MLLLWTAASSASAQSSEAAPVASRTVKVTLGELKVHYPNDKSNRQEQQEDYLGRRRLQETCGAIECCVDCVCCGPNTVWNGVQCFPNLDQNGASLDCDASGVIAVGGCVDEYVCVGPACCGPGTVSVVDPTREAGACYCVLDDTGMMDPTPAPREDPPSPAPRPLPPTESPTPGARSPVP
jgi:hypothetical protein